MTVVIFGCGYTGRRVARRMIARAAKVICTSRRGETLTDAPSVTVVPFELPSKKPLDFVPPDSLILHSIPPVDGADMDNFFELLAERRPKRVIYLSTTGVYGDQKDVNERTPPAPRSENDQERLRAETATLEGPWSGIVLRPAAIYGPVRGVHVSIAEGRFRLVGDGSNFVSRIHVDDLAAHVEAALVNPVEGAWPVADDYPCPSREIAAFCADLLGVPLPPSMTKEQAHHTRRADRRVDGSAIRRELGISLAYPDFRSGIRASLNGSNIP